MRVIAITRPSALNVLFAHGQSIGNRTEVQEVKPESILIRSSATSENSCRSTGSGATRLPTPFTHFAYFIFVRRYPLYLIRYGRLLHTRPLSVINTVSPLKVLPFCRADRDPRESDKFRQIPAPPCNRNCAFVRPSSSPEMTPKMIAPSMAAL
jgi:hypothetical protein